MINQLLSLLLIFSVIYISIIYLWCIWRGGTYYIEVFSERYKMKFVKIDKEDLSYSRETSTDNASDS